MNWILWFLPVVLSLLAVACWILTMVGMPGNWGLVLIGVGAAYFANDGHALNVEMIPLVSIIVLAALGEVIEFFAGAMGVNQLGGSKKGGTLALIGSVVGALAGMFFGIPIPVVGSLVAAVLFGGLGAFGGAVAGERWDGKEWPLAIQIGWGALWGKLLGTLLKSVCGTVLLAILLVSLWS